MDYYALKAAFQAYGLKGVVAVLVLGTAAFVGRYVLQERSKRIAAAEIRRLEAMQAEARSRQAILEELRREREQHAGVVAQMLTRFERNAAASAKFQANSIRLQEGQLRTSERLVAAIESVERKTDAAHESMANQLAEIKGALSGVKVLKPA